MTTLPSRLREIKERIAAGITSMDDFVQAQRDRETLVSELESAIAENERLRTKIDSFSLQVEKRLCEALNEEWKPTGMSIETLCQEIATSLAAQHTLIEVACDERDEAVEGLKIAMKSLKPLSDAVFNDNGDMTVSPPIIDAEQCIQAYFRYRRASSIVSKHTKEGT